MGKIARVCLALGLLLPSMAFAEMAWVIDRVTVGLHQDDNLDSPILKLLATGAELEIIEKNDLMSQVKDESGETGWIKNEFIHAEKPTRRLFEEVSSRNQQLKNQISKLEAQLQQSGDDEQSEALTAENQKLKQDIKSAQLKVGELQAELTRLKKAASQPTAAAGDDNQALYTRISELEQEKIRLEDELNNVLNPTDDGSMKQELLSLKSRSGDLKRHLLYVAGAILIGLILGLIIYDVINRRRHSGFRV